MKHRPFISATVMTYNQEKTIRQTIDSILMQKGDFDMEIVIAEDCSTDHTWDICKEYADKYPNLVRLLPNTHNLGIFPNWIRMVKACKGDFISGLAGDDYWIDDHKLEKQVNFLLEHPDYGLVTTSGYRYLVRRKKFVPGLEPAFIPQDGNVKSFYFSPSYRGGVYVMPTTQMIRRELLDLVDFDEMIRRKLPVEDYPTQAIWSQYTRFGHIPDKTSVYRVYKESATFISFNSPKYLSYHKGLMDIRRYLNELFPADACFSEEWMQDYEFYKEYLLYLHKWQYRKAKALLTRAAQTKAVGQPHYQQAQRMTRNWFRFVAFAMYKEFTYIKDIKNRT